MLADVKAAFLYGDAKRSLYVELPPEDNWQNLADTSASLNVPCMGLATPRWFLLIEQRRIFYDNSNRHKSYRNQVQESHQTYNIHHSSQIRFFSPPEYVSSRRTDEETSDCKTCTLLARRMVKHVETTLRAKLTNKWAEIPMQNSGHRGHHGHGHLRQDLHGDKHGDNHLD